MKFFLWFVETQVNSVNCNTSWKVVLFMKWSDNKETILKGVGRLPQWHDMKQSTKQLRNTIKTQPWLFYFFVCLPFVGWRSPVVPCRAGKVSHLWWPQEKAICISQDHRSSVCHFGHQQQSTLGSRSKRCCVLKTSSLIVGLCLFKPGSVCPGPTDPDGLKMPV